MKTSSKTLFMILTLMSTMLVLNSSSWISMWIGLEMNLMSFIPLISKSKNPFNSQSTMMYFLIQSMSSMMLMAIMLTNKYMFTSMDTKLCANMIMIVMMIKMGMPPFHMWFPELMNKLTWWMCLMLMTWQKIAPMHIISMISNLNKTLILMITITSVMGALGGLNQTSTRKIMAYSSINHMSWMITCAATFKKSWTIYMTMYTIMMMTVSMMLYQYNIMYITQMNMFFKSVMDKILILLMMMSMGGLPPFLGFIPKWITIQYMISSNEFIMMMIMVTCSLITLSYYLRMTTSMNMMTSHSQKWLYMMQTNKNLSTYLLFLNMLLPTFIILMNFY